jgi:hypothetical protein
MEGALLSGIDAAMAIERDTKRIIR